MSIITAFLPFEQPIKVRPKVRQNVRHFVGLFLEFYVSDHKDFELSVSVHENKNENGSEIPITEPLSKLEP
jgi:hypothetical protein